MPMCRQRWPVHEFVFHLSRKLEHAENKAKLFSHFLRGTSNKKARNRRSPKVQIQLPRPRKAGSSMNAPGEFYIFKSRYDSRYRLTASQYQYKTILSKRIFGGKSEQRLQICIGLMRLQLGKPFLEIPSGTRGPDLSMTTAVSHLDASDLQKFLLPITLRALL